VRLSVGVNASAAHHLDEFGIGLGLFAEQFEGEFGNRSAVGFQLVGGRLVHSVHQGCPGPNPNAGAPCNP